MGRVSGWVVLLMLAISCASAQQADTGGVIAEISGGGIFGLGAHGNVSGSLAAPLSRHLLPYIEFAYSPLSSFAFTYGANETGKALFRSALTDINGGVKIRFPSRNSDWVPYFGLGAGLLHITSNTHQSGFGATITTNTSNNAFAGNVSVGTLYYITPHVGLGIEAKGYGAQHQRLGRATVGVFYQFE